MKTHSLSTLEQLTAASDCWDGLWERSEFAFPSTQSAPLQQWMRHFSANRQFRAVVVEDDGDWQAALPLVLCRYLNSLRVARLPGNEWSPVGNLLLDSECDNATVVASLVGELSRVNCALIQLEPVRLDAPHWQRLMTELRRGGWPVFAEQLFDVGQVAVDDDWDTYFASRSRNLRKDLGKSWRRLEKDGALAVKLYLDPTDQQLAELMQRGFAVEDRSWKGRSGTSVLRTPGLLEFYQTQARHLRDRGHLQLSLLELDGQPIAFEYGWRSHATYFSFKVGYDEAYERHSPGQLLKMKLLEHFFSDEEIKHVDFFGPLNSALAAWSTKKFPIGRIVVGRPTTLGRLIIEAYRRVRALRHRLGKSQHSTPHTIRPHERAKSTRAGVLANS